MSAEPPVLAARDLVKVFGRGELAVRAVDGVDLDVSRGELVLVAGPSGSGKTTFLSMLGGLLRPTSGSVHLGGVDLTGLGEAELTAFRARRFGFVFQAYNLLSALSVEDNVLFPARLAGLPLRPARRRAGELLDRLGLSHRRHARPAKLSGGEQQRVAVARALINDPPVILADEPTGNLDSKRGQEVAMILFDITRDDRRAVVLVTHDPRIEDIADRVAWLEDGKLIDRRPEPGGLVRDPVCGMWIDREGAATSTTYLGAEISFCSTRCRERFESDPEGYSRSAAAGGRSTGTAKAE